MSIEKLPTPGTKWTHRNGATYRVLMITNLGSDKPEYPRTVVYQNVANETLWSRPAHDWHRSMTELKP